MMKTLDSIFKVKRINRQGFELYNLVNEKTYNVKSRAKMVTYRHLYRGSYIAGTLSPAGGEYFLSNIRNIIKPSENIIAYRTAVSLLMETPPRLYEDNEQKLQEIQENIVLLSQKYSEFFAAEHIYTSNTKLNTLLGLFNDYVDCGERLDYHEYTESPENADVVVFFDPDTGLQAVHKDEQDNYDRENFSVPTILYSSQAFDMLMELMGKPRPAKRNSEQKQGRNEPCLCGSGRKYKKCCL